MSTNTDETAAHGCHSMGNWLSACAQVLAKLNLVPRVLIPYYANSTKRATFESSDRLDFDWFQKTMEISADKHQRLD